MSVNCPLTLGSPVAQWLASVTSTGRVGWLSWVQLSSGACFSFSACDICLKMLFRDVAPPSPKRSIDDANLYFFYTLHKHPEKPHANTRLLFADLSSALNAIQPYRLARRLLD